jgi:hypothetical protein
MLVPAVDLKHDHVLGPPDAEITLGTLTKPVLEVSRQAG